MGICIKFLNLWVFAIVVFLLVGCQSTEYRDDSEINEEQKTTINNWIIYENSGENYIILNTKTNEKITDVYDENGKKFLSAQEAVDALNNN